MQKEFPPSPEGAQLIQKLFSSSYTTILFSKSWQQHSGSWGEKKHGEKIKIRD
jgi:hypothetical protein